jgi:hypothetical protein
MLIMKQILIKALNNSVFPCNVGKEELTCIDCIYCKKDKNVNSGFICDKNGCEIDNPNEDYCDTYFVWRE